MYDVKKDEWSELPHLPVSTSFCTAVCYRDFGLLFDAEGAHIWALDLNTRKWLPSANAVLPPLPRRGQQLVARAWPTVDAVFCLGGDRSYIWKPQDSAAGTTAAATTAANSAAASAAKDEKSGSSVVAKLAGAWTALPTKYDIDKDRSYYAGCCVSDGRAFMLGGTGAQGSGVCYDPSQNAWHVIEPMSTRRSHFQAVDLDIELA